MRSPAVSIDTKEAGEDWRCLVSFDSEHGASDAYEAACRWLSTECAVRLHG